jgi:hypothetical protein
MQLTAMRVWVNFASRFKGRRIMPKARRVVPKRGASALIANIPLGNGILLQYTTPQNRQQCSLKNMRKQQMILPAAPTADRMKSEPTYKSFANNNK